MSKTPRGGEAVVRSGSGATHSYTEDEVKGYVQYINQVLKKDDDCKDALPLDVKDQESLFDAVANGILLNKLIEVNFNGTIDCNKVNKGSTLSVFQRNENHDRCIAGAIEIGCSVVNIGAADLSAGTKHLVMGLTWQIIKQCLMSAILKTADLNRLKIDGEMDDAIGGVPPEQILLRWFNYHLKNAGHHRIVTNFSKDIMDSENYIVLLGQIGEGKIGTPMVERAFREKDLLNRADKVLDMAYLLGCRKFATPKAITEGNPRLNLAFVATLFSAHPALGPTPEELAKQRAIDLESQLLDTRDLLSETENLKKELASQVGMHQEKYAGLSQELTGLSLKLADALSEKEKLNGARAELNARISILDSDKSHLDAELNRTQKEKDDLFSKLEEEISFKLDFENQMVDAKDKLKKTSKRMAEESEELARKLAAEQKTREDAEHCIELTLADLEKEKVGREEMRLDFVSQLEAEVESRETTEAQLKKKEEEFLVLEQNASDNESKLTEELEMVNGELEDAVLQAKERDAQLTKELEDERAAKEDLQNKLEDTASELDRTIEESDDEKALLLQRIKDLEEELERLRSTMAKELTAAENEKESALKDASNRRKQELDDAEARKDAELKKIQLLLKGNQKQGTVQRQEKTLLGQDVWKKRFCVLNDNLFCIYKNEHHVTEKGKAPLAVSYCENVRVYDLAEADVGGKKNVFQLDDGKQKLNVACSTPEELKEWMTEIRIAKRKKLGVKVVAEESSEQRKAREASKRK
eukprot:TRINITY_DN2827_c0_g2_i1.p1 TRINITY_DN2827_c0_g2~~TRINITY_DN2827_c0_g2_i1.p1  ORF type:complete len:786 (+),score=276.07 TRINITY_DN2827_c0_g2_i1:84-2360(+)